MKNVILQLLRLYKKILSPTLELIFGKGCRFTPTCSEYTMEAVEKFGVAKGTWLGIKRFLRCQPLSQPRYDPVPQK